MIGWIDEEEIKINSASVNLTYSVENNLKVFNLRLVKNSGQAYEYETDSKTRFLNKVKTISMDPNVFLSVDGLKINDLGQIDKWIEGELQMD